MRCEHDRESFFGSECALCKNNRLLEEQQVQNRGIASQNERDARENREAIARQIESNEKLAIDAADRYQEQIRLEREKLDTTKLIQKEERIIAGAKVDFDAADKAWNKKPSMRTAILYSMARSDYYQALGKDDGVRRKPWPSILDEYEAFECKLFDEKGAISIEELRKEWVLIQILGNALSLEELFSPGDSIQLELTLTQTEKLKHFLDTIDSKKNKASLQQSKEDHLARKAREENQRIEKERVAAEKWEAERPIREKEKKIRVIALISTSSVLLLPLLLPNSSLLWAPVLFLLGMKIARIHISQFFLPNISAARKNWIAKIRVFQVNVAGLVVAIPATVTSIYLSLLLFAFAYNNEIVASIYSIFVGAIVLLYLGERNIFRLDKKQSLADFAITLILELYNYLRHIPNNISKRFRV
jgi:AAA15 family ATPase/GTPase